MNKNELSIPLIVKGVTLMSPGTWNGWNYTPEELKKAFLSRDYNSEDISLFLDHPENPNNAATSWVGRVKNLKQMSDSTIKGDLEIYDENTIYKLQIAKAKFGVSPRLLGNEDEQNMSFTDIIFDNWSIVSKPAQNTAMIELASKLGFDGLSIKTLNKDKKELKKDELDDFIDEINSEEKEKNELGNNCPIGKNKIKLKGGNKEMTDEEEKKEVENVDEKPAEESEEEKPSEEKPEGEEELSDADVLKIISKDLDAFNAFKNEYPSLNVKDLAIKFKERNEKLGFVEQLSETEATAMLKKLLDKVGSKSLSAKKESINDSATKELSEKLESIQKEIKELKKVEKVPTPKSAKNLNTPVDTGFSMTGRGSHSEGVRELAREIFGMRN